MTWVIFSCSAAGLEGVGVATPLGGSSSLKQERRLQELTAQVLGRIYHRCTFFEKQIFLRNLVRQTES